MDKVFMCKIIMTVNGTVLNSAIFPTFEHATWFARTCGHPDPSIRVNVNIYGIPFGKLINDDNVYLLDCVKL